MKCINSRAPFSIARELVGLIWWSSLSCCRHVVVLQCRAAKLKPYGFDYTEEVRLRRSFDRGTRRLAWFPKLVDFGLRPVAQSLPVGRSCLSHIPALCTGHRRAAVLVFLFGYWLPRARIPHPIPTRSRPFADLQDFVPTAALRTIWSGNFPLRHQYHDAGGLSQ